MYKPDPGKLLIVENIEYDTSPALQRLVAIQEFNHLLDVTEKLLNTHQPKLDLPDVREKA